MEKTSKKAYKLKEYILPSGKNIKIQGFEPYALDELLTNYNENDILTGAGNVPEIWYDDKKGKYKRHYVDIFIQKDNKCIEVKSTWTFMKKKDNVLRKQKAGKYLGFNYEIWVFNGNGVKVLSI